MDENAVIRVGAGRGFIIHSNDHPSCLVVTAAHCLPRTPDAHPWATDRTWPLLARLGDKREIYAECLFVDPVADLAVLGPPDDQAAPEEAAAYETLTEEMEPFTVGALKSERGHKDFELRGRLLSLEGEWIDCAVSYKHRRLWLKGGSIVGGMSGSPIITKDGVAIGVISNSEEGHPATSLLGPQPRLDLDFPGWLLDMVHAEAESRALRALEDRPTDG